jgi:hypothetical protein
MKPYYAPESSFIPPDYDQERTPCPDSCEVCRFEAPNGNCTEGLKPFITADDLQAAADELEVERYEKENTD